MGTGVATRVVAELRFHKFLETILRSIVLAIVAVTRELLCNSSLKQTFRLESPFNNLVDVIKNHPLSRPFRFLPWFENTVIKPLMKAGLNMSSDDRIKRLSNP